MISTTIKHILRVTASNIQQIEISIDFLFRLLLLKCKMAVLKLLIFSLIFVYFLTIHIQNLLYCSFFVHNFAVLLIKQEFLIIQEVQYQTAVILLFSNDIINGNRKSPFLFSSLLPFFSQSSEKLSSFSDEQCTLVYI